jgi:hypothetical protein
VAGRRVKGSCRVTSKWPIVRLLASLSNGVLTNLWWLFFGTKMPRKITAKNRRNGWRAAAKSFSGALCSSRGKNVCFANHQIVRRWTDDESARFFERNGIRSRASNDAATISSGKTARVKSLFDHTQENAAASAVLESCLPVNIHCRPVRCVNGQHELLVRRHSSG